MTESILYPFVAQGVLVFVSLFVLARRRLTAFAEGKTKGSHFVTFSGDGEPENVRVAQRSFHNQFEMPVLFFAVCLAAVVFEKDTANMIYVAWAYVGARFIHSCVHLTSNHVKRRFTIFLLSNLVLVSMWIMLAI